MGRIPENRIKRLKQDVSLERLAEGAGISLKNTAKTSLACARSMMTTNLA